MSISVGEEVRAEEPRPRQGRGTAAARILATVTKPAPAAVLVPDAPGVWEGVEIGRRP